MITQEEHDVAVAVPLEAQLAVREVKNGCEAAGTAAYFCDYVVKTVLNDAAFGEDVGARQRLLYRGGLTITTTLDRTKQQLAQDGRQRPGAAHRPVRASGVALSSVEAGTGRIVAMAQNSVYSPQQTEEPVPGGTAINYNVDKAMGGGNGFQPGSTYKPFTLATWLAAGNTMNESVERQPARVRERRLRRAGECGCIDQAVQAAEQRGRRTAATSRCCRPPTGRSTPRTWTWPRSWRPVRGPRHRRLPRRAPGRRQRARGLPGHGARHQRGGAADDGGRVRRVRQQGHLVQADRDRRGHRRLGQGARPSRSRSASRRSTPTSPTASRTG